MIDTANGNAPVNADISLTLVYDCPVCDETNIVDFDDIDPGNPDTVTKKIFRVAADLIGSLKKRKSTVIRLECKHCRQKVKIKEVRFW